MPQATKEITRRIKSVGNTKKVTKAMELVSAAKMKKVVESTLASRFYAHYSWDILIHLAKITNPAKHPLLNVRPVKKIAIILITSDKGLCGSYNSAIIKRILDQLKNPHYLRINKVLDRRIFPQIEEKDLQLDFICIGKKGAEIMRKLDNKVVEVFTGLKDRPRLKDIRPISSLIIDEYQKGTYDKIVVAYTDYYSTLKQSPKLRQLLPISEIDLEKIIGDLDTIYNKYGDKSKDCKGLNNGVEYLFEPNKDHLLNSLLLKLVEMQLYQLILESIASEHSARMIAMKNASESANEMIDELTLIFNKARQSAITQEIAEISSGKAALDNI
jgi:F-type H+-transporting ATPase subunit gamma